jgi:ADP-ribose pyrophosphatase YjhB (NUDIX family)
MAESWPRITALSGRTFAAAAVGLLAFIVREDEHILLLAHPQRPNQWEPPNGAWDGNETILAGLRREIAEEAGTDLQVRPLGTLHTYTFRYDPTIPYMVSIAYLFACEGGTVRPGDDMAGSASRWFNVAEIASGQYEILVPRHQPWLFERAVLLYRLLKDAPPVEQQPDWAALGIRNKYGE